jgi:hypothetical protein
MAVRLSALHASRPLSSRRFLVLISVTGWVDPRATVRLEPHREPNPGSFGLRHSASTNYATACPSMVILCVHKHAGRTQQHRHTANTENARMWYKCGMPAEGAGGSVVVWGVMRQAGRSRFQFPMKSLDFSFDLIFPAALWPWGRLNL